MTWGTAFGGHHGGTRFRGRSWAALALVVLLSAVGLSIPRSAPAMPLPANDSGITGHFDTTVSMGAAMRVSGRDERLFSRGSGGPGGWRIIDEPELHLGADIVVPDLAGWRRETMPEYPDAAYCTIAPDWACEVLSPSTRRLDLGEKRDLYTSEGVRHLWFVDPDARTLEAFELREGHWLLLATLVDDVPVSLPPFDAITFPLDALWPEVTTVAGNGEES